MNIFKLNDSQIENWEKIREKGFRKYILRWVLYLGIILLIFFSVNNFIINSVEFDPVVLGIQIIMFIICGILVGAVNWYSMEYGYKISKKGE